MPIVLTWSDITIRLVCAFAAGALIGLNRSEHGRPAGLRTSILVCLAACVAMIQVPCQVVRTSRRIVYRWLSWNPWQGVFLRLVERLHGRRLC